MNQAEHNSFWAEYHQAVLASNREVAHLKMLAQCEKWSRRQAELHEQHEREHPFRLEVER